MANIYKVKVGDVNCPIRDNRILTLTDGSTTAGTWVATADNITAYENGQLFLYQVTVAGTSSTTLNINSIGAKPVYSNGTSRLTTHFAVGSTLLLAYNSTNDCFRVVNFYDSNTTYKSGTGISISGTTINHSHSITALTTAGFNKHTYDAQGHITGTIAVTKSDVTGLGIPGSDTNTAHSHSAGVGLVGSGSAGISGTYDYKVALADDTLDTNAAVSRPSTSSTRIYPIIADKNGKLATIVPWTDTNTHYTNSLTIKGAGTAVTTFAQSADKSIDFVAGSNVTVTPDATNGKITIASSYTDTNQTVKGNGTAFGSNVAVNIVGGSNVTVTPDTTNNKITIAASQPSVGNGQLTMQVNGTTKTTFTANQSGAATFNVTASDLGLGQALVFKGITTTALTDGATTNPITMKDGSSLTAQTGYVVLRDGTDYEFVWANDKWNLLGDSSRWATKGSSTGTASPATTSAGAHTHSVTFAKATTTAATAGAHTHALTNGKAASAGSHTHSVTAEGTIASVTSATGNYQPAGSVSQPSFSSGSAATAGSHSHTVTAKGTIASTASTTGNYQPAGTIGSLTFTGSSVTSGKALSTHSHSITPAGTISVGTGTANYTPAGSVSTPTFTGTSADTDSKLSTHSHTLTAKGSISSATSATGNYQPAGTNSAPKFTGSAVTSGKGSAHAHGFTPAGSVASHSHSIGKSTTTIYQITGVGSAPALTVTPTTVVNGVSGTFLTGIKTAGSASLTGTTTFLTGIKTAGSASLTGKTSFATVSLTATYSDEVITFGTTTGYNGTVGISHSDPTFNSSSVGISHSDPVFNSGSVSSTTTSIGSASGWSAGSVPSRASLTVVTSVDANTGNTAPTFTGTAGTTGDESSHTHSVTAAGTVAAPTFTGTTVALTFEGSSATSSSVDLSHTHAVTATGNVSQPTFTGTGAQLLFKGTAGNTGNTSLEHTHSVTAAGSINTPAFTGTTVSLTFTGSSVNSGDAGSHTHTVTGTVSQPTFTGTTVSLTFKGSSVNTNSTGAHTHSLSGNADSAGGHTHSVEVAAQTVTTTEAGAHTHTVNSHSHTQT